jgi:uncharacterized protein YndB with AHSA1/START domain
MKEQELSIKTKIQILKPIAAIFKAIVEPAEMSNYFISKGSLRMETGAEPFWYFPEFEEGFTIRVKEVKFESYVAFYWDTEVGETLVELNLQQVGENATIVTVTEKPVVENSADIKWLKGNTEGWANFLACMKAWLEYGVHLRKGAFDFMKANQ